MYTLEVTELAKWFGTRTVLKDISFSLSDGDSLAVIGANGSGKTTLLRLVAGLAAPSRGKIVFRRDSDILDRNRVRSLLSYVGPELVLYDALTGYENLHFFATMRNVIISRAETDLLLKAVGLSGRGGDFYRAYSSGMKQRLKYAVALLNDPVFLLLDEPTANLDDDGKRIVTEIITRRKEIGIVLIATNEKEEYDFAEKQYRLNS